MRRVRRASSKQRSGSERLRALRLETARAFAVLVRVLAVLLSLHLSGAAHAIHDAVELVADPSGLAVENPDCDDDQEGTPCPPGCSDCHRAHRNVIPTTSDVLASLHAPASSELAGLAYDSLAPPRPEPDTLDRPPRA